jgi:hypothetical protein
MMVSCIASDTSQKQKDYSSVETYNLGDQNQGTKIDIDQLSE